MGGYRGFAPAPGAENLSSPGLPGAAGSLPSAGGSLGGAFGSPAPPESVAGKPNKTLHCRTGKTS